MATEASRESLKALASAIVDSCQQELYELSDEIWKNPELGFKEYKAHELLTSFLDREKDLLWNAPSRESRLLSEPPSVLDGQTCA